MERRFTGLANDVKFAEKRDDQPAKITGYASVFYDGTPATEYRVGDVIERIMPTFFDFASYFSSARMAGESGSVSNTWRLARACNGPNFATNRS